VVTRRITADSRKEKKVGGTAWTDRERIWTPRIGVEVMSCRDPNS
jgi:hypothetical protein